MKTPRRLATIAVIGVIASAGASAASAGSAFVVNPYYMYPADQPYHPEYRDAVRRNIADVRAFYRDHVGRGFRIGKLRVLRLPDDYVTMRCGPFASAACAADRNQHPNLLASLFRAVGGLKPRRPVWIWAQGAGGFAGANHFGDFQGFAVQGDWVLEPLSGVREPEATHCGFSDGWQCAILGPGVGAPFGTAGHELGHVFGLHHPPGDFMPGGVSLMRWHGDGLTSLFPHEIAILKASPFFFKRKAFDEAAPHLNFENADVVQRGTSLLLSGCCFAAGDLVEFRDGAHSELVTPEILEGSLLRVQVPATMEPGYVRIWRGSLRGNVVAINFVP
jgi:hypothetical protein